AHHDHERVRFFRQADRSPVARAQGAVGDRELRERQNHARGDDRVTVDQHRAVVQGAVRREQADDEIRAHARLQAGTGLGILVEADVALDGDDRADLRARQAVDRLDQLLDDRALLEPVEERQHARLPEPREAAAQLRLEHDERGDRAVVEQVLHQVDEEVELEQSRREERDDEHQDAREDLHGPGLGEGAQHVVEARRDQQDLHEILDARKQKPETIEESGHSIPQSAAATSSAWRTSRTSCTRNSRAPRVSACTHAAIVPGSRSSGGSPPDASPTKRLRDGPTSTGAPIATMRSRSRRTAMLCSVRFAKPSPGSRTIASSGMPAARALARIASSSAITSPTTSVPYVAYV